MAQTGPSDAELSRAFYVDFEGPQDGPAVLVGILKVAAGEESFRQEVLDEDFQAAAIHSGLAHASVRESLERLADEVSALGAVVIAWSEHELEVFERFGSDRAAATLGSAYRNAIPLAKRWRQKCAPDWHPPKSPLPNGGRHTLAAYMEKMGYEVPTAFGPYQTGQRLRAVRKMLLTRDHDYEALTHTVKGKWTKVLRHNEHDCRGMRHVCEIAARELIGDRRALASSSSREPRPYGLEGSHRPSGWLGDAAPFDEHPRAQARSASTGTRCGSSRSAARRSSPTRLPSTPRHRSRSRPASGRRPAVRPRRVRTRPPPRT